ncbi:phage specificity protein (plasmid) [Limosilactobacillus reuteri]|uniref:Putative phage specificity protein n=1 Tax=Limosilactobacillus reuteri subsp. suis (strain ATCC 53608 / LMG 31752 / 1063) TaxID=927703 RepID=F8KG75_LIMR5|nr:putative phage specificity protein [Limosilactobacillus reuteri subsp. suis]CUU13437.1 putative tail-host specificity protein [Limosilactobacillus reuteri subsp. suis]
MEKTIKYLENGEYHYATVRSVGDLAQLKTNSKETLVEAINELWNGGGNADLSKAPKPEGYDQLVQDVADAVKNQQEISQQWIEWQNEEAQLTEERKQAYLQAMKEMQEAIDKAKADAAALDDKTTKLDEQITKTFSDLDTSIQNMHEQLQKEADRMDQELIDTKSDLTKVRTDLQNAQLDNGRIHDELTNINGKFEHKVWQTDLDPLKEQIDRAETSVQQTKDELLGKASRQDLDTVTNTVSKLDTQLKETAKGVEISVKKDELGGEIAEALTNKTNILLGTRRFTTNNWQQREHVEMCSDPWKGFLVAKQNSPIEGIQQAYDVKAGTTYTFSLFAKMDTLDDSNKPQIILAKTNLDTSLDTKIDVWRKEIEDITSDFKRYDLTFTPSEDCTIYPHVISNSNNPIFVCGYQLEIGKTSTPWEPNQEDVGDYVEKSEAQFNVYNDKIQALTEKQRQQGDTQEKLRTEVTQTAEGTRQVSENLKKTNDDITKLRGEFEVKADHMKSEYETYTNKAVGQISDSTLNLIRNSSFQNKDEDFAQWQNVSAKANVRQDENGLRWVELTQSGMTTDNIIGLTSNYFNIKQGKVTVAVDIKSGTKADLDIESVLTLELYDENKKRVDFTRLTLNDLGLNKSLLGDHQVHRGLYRLGIDRNDAKYMTVKALLARNGDLYFTNFSARLSSIDDGAYEPNPDDLNQQILKQNTKIEQNAKEVAIKANSVDVTRDIKSAVDNVQVGGTNLANKTNQGTINWMCDPGNGTTNLTEININGNRGVRFNNTRKTTSWWVAKYALDLNKFEPSTDYVVSFDIRTPMNVEFYGSMFDIAGGDSTNGYFTDTSIHGVIPANKLTHISVSKHTKDNFDKDHYQSFYLNSWNLSRCDWVDFVNFKIEKGNKGTNYSPAPEDVSAEIKSVKDAAIQVASDQINLHVNELSTQFDDKLNKRINEQKTASEKFTSDGIEQVVTKVTNVKNDVDRLGDTVNSVGSRNLLHNTSNQWRTLANDGDWLQKTTASSCWTSVADYHGGDKFTYAAKITNNSHQQAELEIWLCDQNKNLINGQAFHAPIPKGANAYDANVTFPITTGTWYIRSWIIFTGGHAPKGDIVQVKDERLVEGATPGSWTPNPDDINQQITNTNKKIDTQTIDSANIDQMLTQGHYFVRNLTGNPIGGWVYVDVTGNNNDRIRQDVYADQNNQHKYRSWNGSRWSGWEQGAYISDVNNVKTEVTASVKNLGDRVTTEVDSITTRQNNFENEAKEQHSNDVELVRKSDFEDGSKGNWTVTGVVPATNPAPPAELGQYGMKVLQTNIRDAYEDGIWYSVKPGEKFDVDFWCAPSSAFHTAFGLCFTDKNKENWNWQGIQTDQSGQWKHYTGTIAAPTNAAFARPWYQMDKPANNTTNSSWIAKPHIRRQNPQVAEKISELNTKWDVANGQIQGKVTETQVNNILNGKGYATQSWAQTMFQMKSDSITLQAVRDNITNGIQNQVNNIDQKLNNTKIGNKNLFVGTNRGDYGWMISPGSGETSKGSLYIDGENGVRFTNSRKTTSWWVIQFPFDMNKLKPNTSYTISFDIRTPQDRNENVFIGLARGDSSGSPFVESPYKAIHTKANQFVHITQTLTTISNFEKNQQAFYLNNAGIGQCDWVDIVNLMMVEGTQSAEWSPAPEEVGSGQNLLRGTADFSWPTGLGTNGNFNTSFERFDDTSIAFHLWGSKGGGIYTKWGGAFPDGQLQVGETYTFSFDIKGSGTFASIGNESHDTNARGLQVPGDWQRVSISGTIKALDKAFIIYFRDNFDVRIKNVKIERGSKATPWTPHPFDDKDKGVNLLKSTAYWNPADWNHISDNVWYDDNWTDNLGHKAYGHHTAWQGLGQTVYVTPGVYTWSAQIYLNGLDSNDSVYPYMGDGQYNGTAQVQDIRKPMLGVNDQNRWIDYSTTFYVKNAGNLCVRPELNRDHGTIHVGSQKLEHGMVATPWSPSPLDDKTATITLDSADINSMKTQGHYFVRNLANSPIAGWVYVDVTGNNNDRLKQEVYQDNGYEHRSRRWTGSGWTEWTTDVNNKNVVSQINITPDQIKIASNKIVIDGNTDIHGDLRTDRVRLVGKQGLIDMTGDDGMRMANKNGSSILIGNGNIDLMYNNDFRMNIDSSMMTLLKKESSLGQNNPIAIGSIGTSFYANDKRRGMQILYTPGKDDWSYRGADYLGIGYSLENQGAQGQRKIYDQLELYRQDTTINGHLKRKGIHVQDALHLSNGLQIYLENKDNNIQDPIKFIGSKYAASSQAEYTQPYLTLGYSNSTGNAGLGINWWELIPTGRINSSYSYMSAHGTDGEDGLTVSWYSWPGWYGGRKAPSIVYKGKDGSLKNGGFVFYPGGEVCFWQGDFRSNFRWSGIKQTD